MKQQKQHRTKKIRKGDKVVVTTGNDKGQFGTVLGFRGVDRIIVQGIQLRKKHVKKSQTTPNGDIIQIEGPIHVSNVRVCDENGSPLKISTRIESNGARHFVYQDGKKESIHRTLKKGEE